MTIKYVIHINELEVFMYSNLKNYKNGIILGQFEDIASWIPPLKEHMDSKGDSLDIAIDKIIPLRQFDVPEEYFLRGGRTTERVLIEYPTRDSVKHTVLANPFIRTEYQSPWFIADWEGNFCTCTSMGIETLECDIHHMSTKGHHLSCGCNGRKDWGLQEPLEVEVLPSFVNIIQQPDLDLKFKTKNRFKVLQLVSKPVKRKETK